MSILYRRNSRPGQVPAVPPGDLTEAQFKALRPDLRREVENSPLYDLVDHEAEVAALTALLTDELSGKTRDELNQGAAALGIPEPDKLKSKDAVIDAIVALGVAEIGGE